MSPPSLQGHFSFCLTVAHNDPIAGGLIRVADQNQWLTGYFAWCCDFLFLNFNFWPILCFESCAGDKLHHCCNFYWSVIGVNKGQSLISCERELEIKFTLERFSRGFQFSFQSSLSSLNYQMWRTEYDLIFGSNFVFGFLAFWMTVGDSSFSVIFIVYHTISPAMQFHTATMQKAQRIFFVLFLMVAYSSAENWEYDSLT